MTNKLLSLFFLFLGIVANAQNEQAKWVIKNELPITKIDHWITDVLGNYYVVSGKNMIKYDSSGVLKFSQSIKSLGNLTSIQLINTMKIVTFSEEQQLVCVLDNTLTLTEKCTDLSQYDVAYATLISTSSQPDKFWVLDQLNSKLLLLSLGNSKQSQEIKNLKGILNISNITMMKELNNQLFILDDQSVLYNFDVYGSLISRFQLGEVEDFYVWNKQIICKKDNKLVFQSMEMEENFELEMPIADVIDFKFDGNYFYFRTNAKIIKSVFRLAN